MFEVDRIKNKPISLNGLKAFKANLDNFLKILILFLFVHVLLKQQ